MLPPMLNIPYFYISTFRSMCAVPNMVVVCCSLILCFPGVMLWYYLKDSEMVPLVKPLFLHSTHAVFLLRSLYFRTYSASFLMTFPAPDIATSFNWQVRFPLSRIMLSGLLSIREILFVCTCWFHNTVNLLSWRVSANLVYAHTSVRRLILTVSLHIYHVSSGIVLLLVLGIQI